MVDPNQRINGHGAEEPSYIVTPFRKIASIIAPKGMAVFCIGHFAWGKASTAKEAIEQWRLSVKAHPRSVVECIIVMAFKDAYIDEEGALCTPAMSPRPHEVMRIQVRI